MQFILQAIGQSASCSAKEAEKFLRKSWSLIVPFDLSHTTVDVLLRLNTHLEALVEPHSAVLSDYIQALPIAMRRFRSEGDNGIYSLLCVAVTFWGLAVNESYANSGWSKSSRTRWYKYYQNPEKRREDQASLCLLGLSEMLKRYVVLKLDNDDILAIAAEMVDCMKQPTPKLPFVNDTFDLRAHVVDVRQRYAKETQKEGSPSESRERLENMLW